MSTKKTNDELASLSNSNPSLSQNEQIIVDAIIACERASRLNYNFSKPGVSTFVDGVEILWECAYGEMNGKITVNRNWGRPLTNPSLMGEKSNLLAEIAACEMRIKPANDDLKSAQSEYERINADKDEASSKGEAITDAVFDNLAASASDIENCANAIESINNSMFEWKTRLASIESQIPEFEPVKENVVIEVVI